MWIQNEESPLLFIQNEESPLLFTSVTQALSRACVYVFFKYA